LRPPPTSAGSFSQRAGGSAIERYANSWARPGTQPRVPPAEAYLAAVRRDILLCRDHDVHRHADEIEKGRFDFDGSTDPRRNLIAYLELVKKLGLRLGYRPGPFVCNEMAWGGHPRRIVVGGPIIGGMTDVDLDRKSARVLRVFGLPESGGPGIP